MHGQGRKFDKNGRIIGVGLWEKGNSVGVFKPSDSEADWYEEKTNKENKSDKIEITQDNQSMN